MSLSPKATLASLKFVTKRKMRELGQPSKSEKQLRQAEELFEKLFHSNLVGIAISQMDGRFLDVNDKTLTLFGFTREEVIGCTALELNIWVHSEDRFRVEALLRDRPSAREIEIEYRTRSGEIHNVLTSFETIEINDEGRVLTLVQDITQQRQAEVAFNRSKTAEHEQRALAEALRQLNELKSRFCTMAAHEVRTPLAIIQASTESLRNYRNRMSVEQQLEHLNRIESQIWRLTEMMENALTIGQADSMEVAFDPGLLDMESFCRTIVDEIRPTVPEYEIQFTVDGNCEQAAIDPKLTRQILYNLLSNAVKYSPQGGVISLELSCNQGEAIIRVTDQGIGVPEADLKRLFEVFHRAANVGSIEGTGLGLAIVKRAVEAHHGSISVESTVGQGTTFIVTIPLTLPK